VVEFDAQHSEFHLQDDSATAALLAVNTAPLSVSTPAGIPQRRNAVRKLVSTCCPVVVSRASEQTSSREWSSSMLRISTSVPSANCQWVMSACHRSFGISAWNRIHDDLGRFCGCGVTNPRRLNTRQIVDTAGTDSWVSRPRWTRIVSAPASKPFLDSSLRSRMIRSSSCAGTAFGR
jgi:hypothetical protein